MFYSATSSLPIFVQYMGLHMEVSDQVFSEKDRSPAHHNRGKLCYCIHSVMGVLQRCTLRERVRDTFILGIIIHASFS